MLQELYPESFSGTCSWDESWHIFEHQRTLLIFHDTEIRYQRGKGIIRDFRSDIRHRLDQCRFSCIRKSDNPDISDELQLETDDLLLSDIAELCKMWSLTRRGREVRISKSSSPSATENEFLSKCVEVDNTLVRLGV